MARPVRPASENYQPAYCSVSQSFSYSSAAGTEGLEDEDDKAPIFSLSKSSMDVVMATGPPHKRDPAWTRMDMRRSSSTNTHSEQHPHMLQEINNIQAPLTAQHLDTHGRAISDRWLANLERWSGCSSSSTHSRSSTPDTVVWKGVLSRPCSLTQEAFCSSAPDSPMSKGPSSPTTPSPFISPLQTPSLSVEDPLTSFPFPHQQGDSPTTSPVPSPQPAHTTSPLPSPLQAPITSPLQTPTISPLPSPLQVTTTSPLPSPLQAPTTSPLQTPTISPLPSPLQAPTTSPLQTPTISPLPSPLQATTASPLPSPLQAPTISHLQAPTTSPLQTPTISPLPSPLQAPTTSPLPSPLQATTTSPLPSPLQAPTTSTLPSNSPNVLQLTETDNEGFLENSLLSFQYLSPITSSVSLQEGVSSSDPGCLVDGLIEELPEPEGIKLSEGEGMRSPVLMSSDLTPNLVAERLESGGGTSICHLQLPWELGQRSWRSPLVSSLSDSQLRECSFASSKGITQAPRVEVFREEGTMTSQLELVDAAVQTVSPPNSWWDLRRNISSNMGSHSILGSPPGSRLNLRSPVGSHSNLVSPSSSMFPGSSDEEEERQGDDPTWDVNSASSNHLERRRSCLKIHGDVREELGRRSSMKQVQWDEDGMTWEVHGASLDPEVLSTAIRKHLELKNSPQPKRRSSKKKKAPKPPRISNVVKAMTPELDPPVMTITSNSLVERESKETLGADEGKEAEKEGESKKEETVEDARKTSGAEGDNAKEKEEEVCGEEGQPKSPSRGSVISRKRSVIRSLKRPGWCGSSRKTDD